MEFDKEANVLSADSQFPRQDDYFCRGDVAVTLSLFENPEKGLS